MKEKEKISKPKTGKRTPTQGVRFDITSFERIKKTEGLKTAQQIVDLLMGWYDNTKFPITMNPAMERNQPQNLALRLGHNPNYEEMRKEQALGITNSPHKAHKKQKDKEIATPKADLPEKQRQNDPQEHSGVSGDAANRILELEKEINNPPKELSPLAKKSYIFDRKKELENLKK